METTEQTTVASTTSQTNRPGLTTRSVASIYDKFKQNVVDNAEHYSYYASIAAFVVLLVLFYVNFASFSSGGFFWITTELVILSFSLWQNTVTHSNV